MTLPTVTFTPIGVVHSPFVERAEAPRQAVGAPEARGTIELFRGHNYEDALSDLDGFSHVWVLFWFHKNEGWRPKVHPPRSETKRGVFATRSPYRPNPLGMSLVELERVEGLTLHVRGLDILDGTPVLDLKPFVPHADGPLGAAAPTGETLDALLDAGYTKPRPAPAESGWLADPGPRYEVSFAPRAEEQLAFLGERGVELRAALSQILQLGPTPHAYRRIRVDGAHYRIAHKEWRARFSAIENQIEVLSLATGYRAAEVHGRPELELERAFVAAFGFPGFGD
jgi:tRNA-Thr(GGU) m(6)t(6)A37 methyltransferase TsaA